MLSTTNKGDVVLDPFFGTGTTGAVAKRLGRNWIGCEREDDYIEVAQERIDLALPLDESALKTMQSKRAAPKVPFGSLVESGWLAPGNDPGGQEAPLAGRGARRWQRGRGRRQRIDPWHGHQGAERRLVQRLDVLAFHGQGAR
jgi:hypothetical protein